jgi:hypothetical protein
MTGKDKIIIRAGFNRIKGYLTVNGYFTYGECLNVNGNIIHSDMRGCVLAYCDALKIKSPEFKKQSWKFIIDEYNRKGSPIHKELKPLVKRKRKRKKIFDFKGTGNRKKDYAKYLNSNKWISFSSKIKKERGLKCEKCQASGVILHAHHLTYDRLGCERPEDILIVCIPCHEEIHGRKFKH